MAAVLPSILEPGTGSARGTAGGGPGGVVAGGEVVVEQIRRELRRRDGMEVAHWDVRTLGVPSSVRVQILHDPADAVPYRDGIPRLLGEMIARTYAAESLTYRTAGLIDASLENGPHDGAAVAQAFEEYAIEASIAVRSSAGGFCST